MSSLSAFILLSLAALTAADYIRVTSYSSTDCGQGGDASLQTTVTNFACVDKTQIQCIDSTRYVTNSYSAVDCSSVPINPVFDTVPGNGACLPAIGPAPINSTGTPTSYNKYACVSGSYNPSTRTGVRLTTYSTFLANLTCAQGSQVSTPTSYVDINSQCQRYNVGADDDDGEYLSYTISCASGSVRTTYYKGYNCQGSSDTYADQICDSGTFGNWVWSCSSPAAAATNTGAIVGGVLGGIAALAVAVVFILPSSRAAVFRAVRGRAAGASSSYNAVGEVVANPSYGGAKESAPLRGTA